VRVVSTWGFVIFAHERLEIYDQENSMELAMSTLNDICDIQFVIPRSIQAESKRFVSTHGFIIFAPDRVFKDGRVFALEENNDYPCAKWYMRHSIRFSTEHSSCI